MDEQDVTHICPHCGSRDVPTLIVNRAERSDRGISWRCRSCRYAWSDGQFRLSRAS